MIIEYRFDWFRDGTWSIDILVFFTFFIEKVTLSSKGSHNAFRKHNISIRIYLQRSKVNMSSSLFVCLLAKEKLWFSFSMMIFSSIYDQRSHR